MYHNRAWLTFLGILGILLVAFLLNTGWLIFQYKRLDRLTTAQDIQWKVAALGDERFAPQGMYSFLAEGNRYEGSTVFTDDLFRNMWGAEQVLPIYKEEVTQVWYSGTNPQYSSLQKKFPLKECISAVFLVGIFCYFIWLGYYTAARFKIHS